MGSNPYECECGLPGNSDDFITIEYGLQPFTTGEVMNLAAVIGVQQDVGIEKLHRGLGDSMSSRSAPMSS